MRDDRSGDVDRPPGSGQNPIMVSDAAGCGRPLRFGVVCESAPPLAEWLGYARRVEDAGVDVLLVRDHFVPGPFGPQPAPWTALAAAAAATTRLRVGTMVLSNDYRHPALVAHEAATLHAISGGRFELGLGAGLVPPGVRRRRAPVRRRAAPDRPARGEPRGHHPAVRR